MSITKCETECVILKPPTDKSPGPDGFTGNSTKYTKKNLYDSFSNSYKRQKKKELSQSQCMKPPSP